MNDRRSLANAYAGGARAGDVLAETLAGIDARDPVWIGLVPERDVFSRARALDACTSAERARLPLFGVPFAVKDNIDVAGVPTTAGCPAFAYVPERSASVVERLEAAGAIAVGKTNLDQFATGWSEHVRPTVSRGTRSTRATSRAVRVPVRLLRSRADS